MSTNLKHEDKTPTELYSILKRVQDLNVQERRKET